MAEGNAARALKYFEACLRRSGLRISKVALFGSQVRGTATKLSDIDVVIVSKDFEGKDIFERAQLTKDAEISTLRKFMIPMDIISLTPEEWANGKSSFAVIAQDAKLVPG